MKSAVVRQMQEDRQLGNFTYADYDERVAELRKMGAANWERPPLPVSPCIKLKSTGEVHEWSEFFANRPDLCDNCDEYGNTDERAWRGRAPGGSDGNGRYVDIYANVEVVEQKSEPEPVAKDTSRPELEAPQGLMFFLEDFEAGGVFGDVPQMNLASVTLGVPSNFSKDYTDNSTTKAALPLVNGQPNAVIGDAIQQAFNARVYV